MKSYGNPELSSGYWYDQGGSIFNCFQFTTSQYWSIVVGLFVALSLALASPWIFTLAQRLLLHLAFQFRRLSSDRVPLLVRNRQNDSLSKEKAPVSYWLAFALTGVALLLVTSLQLANRFATDSGSCNSGLVDSGECGLWVLDKENSNDDQYEQDVQYQVDKERRAAEYARLCYRGTSFANPEACMLFVEKRIPYTVRGDDCPFSEGLCVAGPSGAITFDTGLVPVSKLGLNINGDSAIHRKTTCAPVTMNQSFVEEVKPGPGHREDWQYRYKYGNVTSRDYKGRPVRQNYTFLMPGDPFRWDVGTYSVWIYEFIPHETDHHWTPIHQLMPPENSFLTLMLIASCHILYRDTWPADDVFPRPELDPSYPGLFINPDPRPRPLACVDEVKVCTHNDEKSCSPIHPASDSKNGYGYEFARLALKRSKIYDSIQFRMGTALLAQESVGQFRSRPLCGPNDDRCEHTQWILEAQALFETSLARLQFDALDIAMGLHSGAGKPYHDDTARWAQGNLCGMFKIQLPKDYRNINLFSTVFYILTVGLLGLLQRDSGRPYPDADKDEYFGVTMTKMESIWYMWICCVQRRYVDARRDSNVGRHISGGEDSVSFNPISDYQAADNDGSSQYSQRSARYVASTARSSRAEATGVSPIANGHLFTNSAPDGTSGSEDRQTNETPTSGVPRHSRETALDEPSGQPDPPPANPELPTLSSHLPRVSSLYHNERYVAVPDNISEVDSTSRPHVRLTADYRDDASDVVGMRRTNTWARGR